MFRPYFSLHSATIFPLVRQNLTVLLFLVFSGMSVVAQTLELSELLSGLPVEREILEKEEHSYRVKAQKGDFVRIVVLQQNADIVLKVLTPSEQKLYDMDNFGERGESERFSFIAEADAEYRVKIGFTAKLRGQSTGKGYLIRLETLRPPSDKDRRQIVAEKLYDQASLLSNENKAESRRTAIKHFQEALTNYQAAEDRPGEAQTFYGLGIVHSLLSEFTAAKENFTQASRIFRSLDMKPQLVRVIVQDSAISLFTGDNQKAEELSLAALEIYRQLNDRRGEAEIIGNLGVLANRKNEPRRALEYFEQALPIIRAEKDRENEARILRSIGVTYNNLGEPFKAIEAMENALAISRAGNELLSISSALISLGVLSRNIGEVQRAIDQLDEALQIVRQLGNRRNEAICLNNLGSYYEYLGDTQTARQYYENSLTLTRQLKMRDYEVNALYGISNIELKEGNLPKALELSTQGWQIAREIGNKRLTARLLSKVGETQLNLGDREKALEYFNQALTIQREIEDREGEAATLIMIGKTQRQNNDLNSARQFYDQALQISQEMNTTPLLAIIYGEIAEVEKDSKNISAAQTAIEKAIEISETTRAKLLRNDSRTGYFSGRQNFYEFYIDVLMTQGKKGAALQATEQARARSLLESLGESRFNIRAGISPENLEKEKRLRQTINAKESQRLDAVRQKLTEKAAEYEKEIAEAFRQYQDLQVQVRQSNPQFASLVNPEPLGLEEIQKQVLDEDTVLLEYFLGEKRSFLFLVSKNNLEFFELPSRQLMEEQVRQTLENLKSRAQTIEGESVLQRDARIKKTDLNAEKDLGETSQILLAPVVNKIQNKRLLVVASGILQYLPFAALPHPSAKPEKRYLVETNEIINLPSASILPLLRQAKRSEKAITNQIAILADPVFSADDARLKMLSKQNTTINTTAVMRDGKVLLPTFRSGFARLRFSRNEAEAIAELASSNQRFVALDFAANLKAANSENLQNSRIVHFATHGVVNSQFPELSGIVLSLVDEKGASQEGFLRLHDVYNLRLEADLVVLSACETALGKEVKGEGIVGLTRGFMFAGVPTIAASLWRVEDRATAELMKRFYRAMLKDNQKPATALRTAQIEMLKEEQWQNPFYWAAFTLQGDW